MLTTNNFKQNQNKETIYVPGKYYMALQAIFEKDGVSYRRLNRSEMNDADCTEWMNKFKEFVNIRKSSMIGIETSFSANDIFSLCRNYDNDEDTQALVDSKCRRITEEDVSW